MRRGNLCIATSTGGASPKLAQRIRRQLETIYTPEYSAYLELLAHMRNYIKERINDPSLRSAALQSLIDAEAEALLRGMLKDGLRDGSGGDSFAGARIEAVRIVEEVLYRQPE